jgi:hypothetical protein
MTIAAESRVAPKAVSCLLRQRRKGILSRHAIHRLWRRDQASPSSAKSVALTCQDRPGEGNGDLTTEVALDPDRPTIGFARRMTGYKRPDLLFADLEKLQAINERLPFQIVVAGKATRGTKGARSSFARSDHPERARPEGAGARRVPAELRYGARRPLDR